MKLIPAILIILIHAVAFSATGQDIENFDGLPHWNTGLYDDLIPLTSITVSPDEDSQTYLTPVSTDEEIEKCDGYSSIMTGIDEYGIPTMISCHEWLEQNKVLLSNVTTGITRHISSMEVDDVIDALKLALKYLEPDEFAYLVHRPPVEQLRYEADLLEQKEKDIKFIKSILETLEK